MVKRAIEMEGTVTVGRLVNFQSFCSNIFRASMALVSSRGIICPMSWESRQWMRCDRYVARETRRWVS